MRRMPSGSLGGILLLAIFLLAACNNNPAGTPGRDQAEGQKKRVTVGVSGSFAENQIVAEMYAQVLEKAGYRVDRRLQLKSRDISEPALERGEIDIVPEYLGSLLVFLDKDAAPTSDPQQTAEMVREALEGKNAVLLEPSKANDTNALVVTSKTAQDRNLTRVSDLAPIAGRLTLGGPPECPTRPFCIPGLREKYGITFREFKPLDVGGPITVSALEGGEIDVALLFTTSGVLKKRNLVALQDDKGLQQSDHITPLVNKEVLNAEIRRLLNGVSSKLTTGNISDLNARVEVDKEDPADVARQFLEENELL